MAEQVEERGRELEAAAVMWRHRRGGRQERARGREAVEGGRLEEGRARLRTARVALERGDDAEGVADADAGLRRADELEAAQIAGGVAAAVGQLEGFARLLQRAVVLGAAGDWAVGRARAKRRGGGAADAA